MLADCRCDAITQYFASLVEPATSQLLIVMELMAATAADLVRPTWKRSDSRAQLAPVAEHLCCRTAAHIGFPDDVLPVNRDVHLGRMLTLPSSCVMTASKVPSLTRVVARWRWGRWRRRASRTCCAGC